MGREIDFLAVGEESKSGDAIALRYGNLSGPRSEQTVVIVDGGFTDDGERLAGLVRKYYKTDQIDIVVSTHPDQDHTAGLKYILEEMDVRQLWMHLPWNHSASVAESKAGGYSLGRFSEVITASMQSATDLEEIANRRGIPIAEPFTGLTSSDDTLLVLGPEEDYYESLLEEMVEAGSKSGASTGLLRKAAEAVRRFVSETLQIETLSEDGETSASNNSSTVLLLTTDGKLSLLTGDAGIPALSRAMDELEGTEFKAGSLNFVQVPHHGSRRNVGPSLLDRMLGPKVQDEHSTAFVSSAKKGEPKHPSKKVANAFKRRGYRVHATQGQSKWHHHDAPERDDYSSSTPLPFYGDVEEDED